MKKFIFCLYMAAFVFSLGGCGLFTEEDGMELTQEDFESMNHMETKNVTGSSVRGIKTLLIYTIDNIEGQLVPLRVPITSDKVTPELIMNRVLENIDEKVVVTEIDVFKRCIYVSFDDNYVPLRKCTKKFETLILDCISNSLLDNIDYVDSVVFRSEKGAYQSANYTFDFDEVYSTK